MLDVMAPQRLEGRVTGYQHPSRRLAAATPLLSIRLRLALTMFASVLAAALYTVATQIAFDKGTILSYSPL